MRAEWELADGTRVEAKLVDFGKWSVRVNGVEVASTSKRIAMFSNDTSFSVTHGRDAVMSMRKTLYGGPELDLHIDGQVLLYPGRKPFRCPACRTPGRPDQRACSSCNTALPDRARRVQARRFRGLFWNIMHNGLFLFALATAVAVATIRNPSAAMARLQTTHTAASHVELQRLVVENQQNNLIGIALIFAVLFAFALLSRRAPLSVAAVNLAFWLGMGALAFQSSSSFLAVSLHLIFIWSASRGLRLARQIRAAEAALGPHATAP